MACAKTNRTSIKSSLTRFSNYFNTIKDLECDEIDLYELQRRLNKAETLLDDFNTAQSTIEAEDKNYDANCDAHSREREKFENDYYKIIAATKKLTNSFMNTNKVDNNDSTSSSESNFSNIRLPQLSLPSFDGSFDQWLFFRDSFTSIRHENSSMSKVQKFHYLRLSLQGKAADKVKSLQLCDANYDIAWKLLKDRFEDKQFLIKNHIKALFDLPTLTKESYYGLTSIRDGIEKNLNALEVLQRPTEHCDDLIIYLITNKFDNTTKRAWESRTDARNIPTLQHLLTFLEERCRILSSITQHQDDTASKQPHRQTRSFVSTTTTNCTLCNASHSLYTCDKFLKLTPLEKLNTAKRLRLCINCLGTNHVTRNCKSSGCRKCGKVHHTLLHFQNNDKEQIQATQSTSKNNTGSIPSTPNEIVSLTSSISSPPQTLLSTACITVFDNVNNPHQCRVLLDSGSQINFISEKLSNILQLPKTQIDTSISGINQLQTKVTYSISLLFKSNINNFQRRITCVVLTRITDNLPSLPISTDKLRIPENISLADSEFNKPAPIDLLIGADIFWDLISIGQIKLGRSLPILQKTKLGWLISGPIHTKTNTYTSLHCSATNNLDTQLSKFWEIEEYPKTAFLSDEENYCEQHFKENVTQDADGRFIVTIPLKKSISELGDSRTAATNRFFTLEHKLLKNNDMRLKYHQFIKEYIDLGHMSLAEDQDDKNGFFLPHHCVLKAESTTTQLRVVFDGSAKSSTGVSLNDLMMVGPNIQDNLFYILLRFRKHNYVLSADVEKMYRQVLVQESQRNLQKILWRFNANDSILVYTLNTVTYGLASASFLAIRSLQEVAHRNMNSFPKISNIILHDFYVDDLLTGAETVNEIIQIKEQITSLLLRHGFPLRKWISNDPASLSNSNQTPLHIGEGDQTKTLGLLWNPNVDCLQYSISGLTPPFRITKRQILSSTAQIFDPLGLLSPVTVTAKIILQELWKLKISWDETVPADLYTTWSKYHSQLQLLNSIKIPRQVSCPNPTSVELHGFCDASQHAYGASIYIRCCDTLGSFTSNLYCAKTRVAPLKTLTIPRLELSGAVLLAQLVSKVTSYCEFDFQNIYYWIDSTICLSWINSSPHILKTFVANRVATIQQLSNVTSWCYVNTKDNPADLLTRGMTPSNLASSNFWFHGPSWLIQTESQWPTNNTQQSSMILTENLPEVRNTNFSLINIVNIFDTYIIELINKHSSFFKLQRIFAYVLRYMNNLRIHEISSRQLGPLTVVEQHQALFFLIRAVQRYHLSEEYHQLSSSKPLNRRSKLLSLHPFFDTTHKVIRVGGRLQHSNFDLDKRHPIILPSKCHLTIIIARSEHIRLLHTDHKLSYQF
ncbi:uncharacterized protein [Diabrotica undecimpunctata]|uniref:uncharacterized protein n=1 Tax=Diabrotica undecimpunctata TaxID=50387 RepID=UPI003B635EBB